MLQKIDRFALSPASRAAAEPAAAQARNARPAGGATGFADAIHGSAPMAAQRRRIGSLFGGNAVGVGASAPVQRMIKTIYTTGHGVLRATYDTDRPPGVIKDSEGDHMTPFLVMQHEIVNAINGLELDEAWGNLAETYNVYQTLPGWDESRSTVRQGKASWGGYIYHIPTLLGRDRDLDSLLTLANALLALRNQIALSAMPGKQAQGVGHAESDLAGGLHALEDDARSTDLDASLRDKVIHNMGMVFDHGRNDGRMSGELADATWRQHCMTVVAAYPVLSAQLKIKAGDLLPLRGSFSSAWHEKFG